MKKISLLLVCFLITSCVQAANFPALFSGQKISRDIDFGSKYGSKLDIYQPSEVKESYPVIVFYHGGRWTTGSKNDYKFVAEAFTSRGYMVVIPDYVKYPKGKFADWQADAAKSFAWVHNNISAHKGDPWRTYVAGHSAGAHIGAMLASNANYLFEEQGSRSWIKAFAGIAGPYDFVPEEADIKDMFGPPEQYPYMQVTSYIDGNQPPMLLLAGKDDTVVEYSNITKLEAAIKQNGGQVETKTYNDTDHIGIIGSMAKLSLNTAPVASDIDEFFKKNSY